jgi:TolA-binding protein
VGAPPATPGSGGSGGGAGGSTPTIHTQAAQTQAEVARLQTLLEASTCQLLAAEESRNSLEREIELLRMSVELEQDQSRQVKAQCDDLEQALQDAKEEVGEGSQSLTAVLFLFSFVAFPCPFHLSSPVLTLFSLAAFAPSTFIYPRVIPPPIICPILHPSSLL